jgi:hypothetical protein
MDACSVRKTVTLVPNNISIKGQYLLALEWDCSLVPEGNVEGTADDGLKLCESLGFEEGALLGFVDGPFCSSGAPTSLGGT